MAYDTSMLTPDVHRRLAAGETVEQIAATVKDAGGQPLNPDAVRQYVAKIDEEGCSRKVSS